MFLFTSYRFNVVVVLAVVVSVVSLALPQGPIRGRMGDLFPEERFTRQGQRLYLEASEAVEAPGMFAKEEQSLLGGCRTTNQPVFEILVLLAAKIAHWRSAGVDPVFICPKAHVVPRS